MNKIINLKDGICVEVEIDDQQAKEISFQNNTVSTSIEEVNDFLIKIIRPISDTYKSLIQDVNISETKVTLGVKIGVEGGFILAKSTAEAHIQVEMTIRN